VRYEAALAARRESAEAFRRGERDQSGRYLAASAELDAARKEAIALVEKINGGRRYNDTNYIFPTYILGNLPRGLVGLVIAVIFAAAMSALSGEMNALASATMVDFYKRYVNRGGTDAHDLLVSRLATVFWGGFACLVALQAGKLGSAIEVVNRFGSYFYGSILGVFALAVLTPRASSAGAFYGLMIGMGTVALVAQTTRVHFLWYNVVGASTVFMAGLALTALQARARATA
jgi:Na+/proline symporter